MFAHIYTFDTVVPASEARRLQPRTALAFSWECCACAQQSPTTRRQRCSNCAHAMCALCHVLAGQGPVLVITATRPGRASPPRIVRLVWPGPGPGPGARSQSRPLQPGGALRRATR